MVDKPQDTSLVRPCTGTGRQARMRQHAALAILTVVKVDAPLAYRTQGHRLLDKAQERRTIVHEPIAA